MRITSRQQRILREIEHESYIEVKDLAARLDVDVSTIRRDLQLLVSNDLVTRLHGGVRRRSDAVPDEQVRQASRDEYRAIAATARRLVRAGDTLSLGYGPCVDELASLLTDAEDVTIITADIQVAGRLVRYPNLRVLLAGGELLGGSERAVATGSATVTFLEDQPAQWAFVEVEGIHPFAGLTISAPRHVAALRALMRAAERRVVLAPSSTFGTRCVGFVADCKDVDLAITDENLVDEDLPAFEGRVVRGAAEPTSDWRARRDHPTWTRSVHRRK